MKRLDEVPSFDENLYYWIMNKLSNEIKIALVALLGILVLYFGMTFLKGMFIFSHESSYFVRFDRVDGLTPSSPVLANGFKVGIVKKINYDFKGNNGIVAELEIEDELQIPQGTKAVISSDLLGNVRLQLHLSDGKTILKPGDTIEGAYDEGALASVKEAMPTIQQLIPKIDSILTNVNYILGDPHIQGILSNVYNVTGELKSSTTQLASLMGDTRSKIPALFDKAGGALDNTTQMMADAEKMTSQLSQIDFQSTMAKLDNTVAQMQTLTQKLNSTEGSLGLMLNDTQLYDNLAMTIKQADSLLVDLREHPKRYVHFSIFGKKDK